MNALNGSVTKLAEQLASPGLVLPWLFSSIGAPMALAGPLVPVKDAGSIQALLNHLLRGLIFVCSCVMGNCWIAIPFQYG